MACSPLGILPGLFETTQQGFWSTGNGSAGGRSITVTPGAGYTVNGTAFFPSAGTVRHRFFGAANHLAVVESNGSDHALGIIDFTVSPPAYRQIFSAITGTGLPRLQPSAGNGAVFLSAVPTTGGLSGIGIHRSDTGQTLVPFGGAISVASELVGKATDTALVIMVGGTEPASGALPAGRLRITPSSRSFGGVPVGGCAVPAPQRTFTLSNIGNDCLDVGAIADAPPFRVVARSRPPGEGIRPGESMTVTVAFEPTATGPASRHLAVTRSPAVGDDRLSCSGSGEVPQAGCSAAMVGGGSFGYVPVGTTVGPRTLRITNTGQMPLTVSVAASTGGPFTWPDAPPQVLTCGQSRDLPVSFAPSAEGAASAMVTVDAGAAGIRTVPLSGEGCVARPRIDAPPSFPTFGQVRQGYRMVRFARVRNTGNATLTFSARIEGPDAALFGLVPADGSIVSPAATRAYEVAPTRSCGPGATGDAVEEVAVVFFADGAPPRSCAAQLVIDGHNDPVAGVQPSFAYPLTAEIIAGNVVDLVAVLDRSDSMNQPVPNGPRKLDAAVDAGRLLFQLLPPDRGHRAAATRFSVQADTFVPMTEVTAMSQPGMVASISTANLATQTATALAAGVMVGSEQFAVPRPSAPPGDLVRAVVALTDGIENTAYRSPGGQYFSIIPGTYRDPDNSGATVTTQGFAMPPGVKVYAVGLGTGQDVSIAQLDALASSTGGRLAVVDTLGADVRFQLMKAFTQVFMDLVDRATIIDPRATIAAGDRHEILFRVLAGDVSLSIVVYDIDGGIRLPFHLETPAGEIIDPNRLPPGYEMRPGWTDAGRFLEIGTPVGEPERYAGEWKLVVWHDGSLCLGLPRPSRKERDKEAKLPDDFRGLKCRESKRPVNYGYAIAVGSNFRLQAFVTPGPVAVGEPILLTGVLSEAGLPVVGGAVDVEAVSPSGQRWTLSLKDDGTHDDGAASDGEHALPFRHTLEAGSYVFTFRAVGQTRAGEPARREVAVAKYVHGPVTGYGRDPGGIGQGAPVRGGDGDCCERLLREMRAQRRLLEAILKSR
ncbi:choice-of-anchor D domain-containing protein [Alsobacter sp. R-9]